MAKLSEAQVAQRAYEIWEKQGRPHGKHHEHWLQATAELSNGSAPVAPPVAAAPKPAAPKPAVPKSAAKVLKTAVAAAAATPKEAVTAPARTKTAPAKKK
jgi:hypothetical protein